LTVTPPFFFFSIELSIARNATLQNVKELQITVYIVEIFLESNHYRYFYVAEDAK
jgi:hypothetical protein